MKQISESKKNEMSKVLMNKAEENVKKLNCTLDEGLRMAVSRLMKEYPVAAMAFLN